MREIAYVVRGFLTVRRDSLRVSLSGSLTVRADPDSGLFSGDLTLHPATISQAVLGARLFSATVQIEAESPVIGRVDPEGRMFAAVTVDAVIATAHAAGRVLISDGSCRTATHAVVPLRSKPGFDLERGGRVVGRYHRPPFTGCGWITPLVNLLIAGSGNAVVIDLIPTRTLGRPTARTEGPSMKDDRPGRSRDRAAYDPKPKWVLVTLARQRPAAGADAYGRRASWTG